MNRFAECCGTDPFLLSPISFRQLDLKNRVVIAPMAMYAANEGFSDDFHLVHLGRFALGGAGLVFVEAAAVSRQGRITPGCSGLWLDAHIDGLRRITSFLRRYGCAAGIQLGHSGRKGSTARPWDGGQALAPPGRLGTNESAWNTVSATDAPFADNMPVPAQLEEEDLSAICDDYVQAAHRADAAGFDVIEIHAAHGYLLHTFLSPLSNTRTDRWGGDLDGRMRFPLKVIGAVRRTWPQHKPLFVRISSVDGVDIGWSLDDSIALAQELRTIGVDAIDCSSGGMPLPRGKSLVARQPGFHVPFCAAIREQTGLATVAVGLIRDPHFAEQVLVSGQADLIAVAREALFNPNWAAQAAVELTAQSGWRHWPTAFGYWLDKRARSLAR